MRRVTFLFLPLVTACSFAHQYKSGEVPRLHVYSSEALVSQLKECEVAMALRRDLEGRRLLATTFILEGNDCTPPISSYVLRLERGHPIGRVATQRDGPSEGAVVTDDGTVLGSERHVGNHLEFEFIGGPVIDGYVEVYRDQSGAPFYSAWHHPEGTEIAPLSSPRRVVARSSLRGRLFSRDGHHYVCGWTGVKPWEGACDVFDSDQAREDWRLSARLLFGNHGVVDMDPSSDLILVATWRDDLEPFLFTVDLKTWEWKYIGAGPADSIRFMNADPLGR